MIRKLSESSSSARILLVCMSLSVVSIGCSQKIDTAEEFVEVAYRHERNQEFSEAVVAYQKAISLSPNSATIWYDMGVAYAALDQIDDAIDAYSNSLKLDPRMEQSYNNRAAAYATLKQFEKAVADCDEAIKLSSDDAIVWRNRGLAHHDLGLLDKAASDYDESIRINGRSAETYLYRGNLFLETGQPARALEDFDQATHLNDQLAAVRLSRAKALSAVGRRADAENDLQRAKELGADIADVTLEQTVLAATDAQMADASLLAAVEFVVADLQKQGTQVHPAHYPWNLKSRNDDSYFLVKLTDQAAKSQHVTFSRAFLDAVEQTPNVSATLIIVKRNTTNDAKREPFSGFSVLQTIPSWTPDVTAMTPIKWSLPLENNRAETVSANR